jgi:hypothetical protein
MREMKNFHSNLRIICGIKIEVDGRAEFQNHKLKFMQAGNTADLRE